MLKATGRILLIILGWIFVIVGIIALLVPVLPTSPFILLAAFCFARSSKHFHHMLQTNKHFGYIVRAYEAGYGIPYWLKRNFIGLLWFSLPISMWMIGEMWAVISLLVFGVTATVLVARLKAYREDPDV